MDIGAATQAFLKDLKITTGKKQATWADCWIVVVNINLKLVVKTPVVQLCMFIHKPGSKKYFKQQEICIKV